MTPNDAAETLTFECDMLFESAEKDPASLPAMVAKIRELIAAAEQARLCPHLVIWRLRRRLAALCERLGKPAVPPTGRRFKHG